MASLNNVRISLKIDDLSNWISSNIVLNNGEVALVRNSNGNIKVKIGDGVSQVSALNYLNETEFFTKKLSTYTAAFGLKNVSQQYSVAEGHNVSALGAFSHAEGFNAETISTDNFSFVWNGQNLYSYGNRYKSHGSGTFSLNPTDGLSGIYIGEETLAQILNDKIYIDGVQTPSLSINRVSQDEYHELVVSEQIDENSIYIVSSDTLNMYGERIENVGDAVEITDATNKNYVDSTINEVSTNIESEISELSETLTSNIDVVNSTITNLSDTVKSNYVSVVTFNSTISELNIVDTNLSNAISSKIKIDNTDLSALNIYKVTADEYHNLIVNEEINQSALYVVSSDTLNMYGEKIINLAAPIENNDATNKEYVDNISVELNQKINDIEIPTKVSELENDSNYALSNDIKSEFTIINNNINVINSNIEHITDNVENLSINLSSKIKLNDNSLSTLNIYKVTADEYHELVASESVNESALYIVSSDVLNMYGERIENVGDAVEDTDAVNKQYVDTITTDLSNEIKSNYVSSVVFNNEILKLTDIDDYLSNAISSKINIDGINVESLSILKIDADSYHELVTSKTIDPNTLYIISSETTNVYGQRIENVGDAVEDTDAVNKQYADSISIGLDQKINAIEIPTKVSDLENDLNYALSSDVSVEFKNIENTIEGITNDVEKLSTDLSSKIKLNDNVLSTLNIYKVTADEYHELVTSELVDESAIYIVSSDTLNMYEERIENVGDPLSASDAVNKQYVDAITTDLSNEIKSNYVFSNTFDEIISELNHNNAYLSNEISSKIKLDNIDLSTLNIYKVTASEYHELVASESVDESALYIVSSDSLDMYGEKIVNLANGSEAQDAATYGQLSAIKEYEDKRLADIQVIKPDFSEHRLHVRMHAYSDEEMSESVVSADSAENSEYFYGFIKTGETSLWQEIPSDGFGSDFNNCPILIKLIDLLKNNDLDGKYSRLFIKYEWYYSLDGDDHVSDSYSIVVPSYTEVGANSSDYVTKAQHEELKSLIRKDSHTAVEGEDGIPICYADKTNILSGELTGQVDVAFDNFSESNEYDIKFKTGSSAVTFAFFYIDPLAGAILGDWNINSGKYVFPENSEFLIKIRQDLIEVVENKYPTQSSSYGYKLIKAKLVGTTSDVSCFIENRSITTIDLNDASLSVTIVLPETQYAGYARDFILRLNITEMPFMIWDKVEDGSWHIDSESGDWTELELGQNIISFTEMG